MAAQCFMCVLVLGLIVVVSTKSFGVEREVDEKALAVKLPISTSLLAKKDVAERGVV